jgi:hypothetical protein
MHYQQGEGKYPIHVPKGSFASRRENYVFVQGELAFLHLGALFRLNFSHALLPMVSIPFASP